jgi:hypothetical protein
MMSEGVKLNAFYLKLWELRKQIIFNLYLSNLLIISFIASQIHLTSR